MGLPHQPTVRRSLFLYILRIDIQLRHKAYRFWGWAATWDWYNALIGVAAAVLTAVQEYAAAVLCVWLAALSGAARMWKWRSRTRKLLGSIAVVLVASYFTYVIDANRGEQSWSHVSGLTRVLTIYVSERDRPQIWLRSPSAYPPKYPPAQEVSPTPDLYISLALITVIHRMRDPQTHELMRGGFNDLDGVLLACQRNGQASRHVDRLLISGDVAADFSTYLGAFGRGDGTESVQDMEKKYSELKPYFRIFWQSYPLTPNRIDQNDEDFIRFKISETSGMMSFVIPTGASEKDYFGFKTTGTEPKFVLTSPVWDLLVRFSGTASDFTGVGPVLREEVSRGKVRLQADVDGELISIPPDRVHFPWAVPLAPESIDGALPQDLFKGGGRPVAVGNDTLVQSECWR